MSTLFLSCDWGTSSFRLRLIDTATLQAKAESISDEGVANVFEEWQQRGDKSERLHFYQSVLRRHIAKMEAELNCDLNALPIVISGMASSTIGIMELPYKPLPFLATGKDLYYKVINITKQFRHTILLVSGARTERDVMRGEETQLAGCVQEVADQKQVFVFPGTHSKHVTVENGYATSFETYMTGEFFHLLSENSILSKSVLAGGTLERGENGFAFQEGVLDSRHQNLLHDCFMVRTNDLFQRFSKEQNFWYLSGLIIGAELNASLQKAAGSTTIVGQGSIASSYKLASETLGLETVGTVDVNKALARAHFMILQQAGM
jgi:2-dehydro-3-deoxygalactonokinase